MRQAIPERPDSVSVTCIVFSKDRPLQLDATLASMELCFDDLDLANVNVLYTTSSPAFAAQYRIVAADRPRAHLRRERDFKADVTELAAGAPYVLFVVDDALFVADASLADAMRVLEADPTCIGVSYRLGRNTTYCYTRNRAQGLPDFEPIGGGLLRFEWPGAECDFGYPLEISSSLYRSPDVVPLLSSLTYRNPNTLEAALAREAGTFRTSRPHLACPDQSVALSVPANLVQTAWSNRVDGRPEVSAESLAREFAHGHRLDVARYRGHVARAAHEELDFVYTRRADIPAVSVVIPCYGQAEFLPEAVESVVGQSFSDWEVIIVDDGSPDRTAEVAEELARLHPDRRIRLVRKPNGGLPRARNTGIEHARGSYILPLDADDRIAPEMLERTHALLEQRPDVAIAYTDLQRFGEDGSIISAARFNATVLPDHNQLSYCALYRREVWEAVGGYNLNMLYGLEDWDFWIGAMERGYAARKIPEPLFEYRVRAGSMYANALAHRRELHRQIRLNHPALYRWDRRFGRWVRRGLRSLVVKISRRVRAVTGRLTSREPSPQPWDPR